MFIVSHSDTDSCDIKQWFIPLWTLNKHNKEIVFDSFFHFSLTLWKPAAEHFSYKAEVKWW